MVAVPPNAVRDVVEHGEVLAPDPGLCVVVWEVKRGGPGATPASGHYQWMTPDAHVCERFCFQRRRLFGDPNGTSNSIPKPEAKDKCTAAYFSPAS